MVMKKQVGRPIAKRLKLSRADVTRLEEIIRRRTSTSGRRYQRARMLLQLHEGLGLTATAEKVGVAVSTVQKIRDRYVAEGLESALEDKPRSGQPPKCSPAEEERIIAVACSAPADGASSWSIRLLLQEIKRRGIVDDLSRETLRIILERHELKPWLEKNVVRAQAR